MDVNLATRPAYWQPTLALLAIGGIYLLLSSTLNAGPRWLVLSLVIALLLVSALARQRGMHRLNRRLALSLTGVVTLALAFSVSALLTELLQNAASATVLLRDAALIWLTNMLVFALWYWEIDGGGPLDRHDGSYDSTDFVFPQMTLHDDNRWVPDFIDYLFLSFNTCTAFSPTDTLFLSHRVKLLMMLQSLIALLAVAVLAARALNMLGG